MSAATPLIRIRHLAKSYRRGDQDIRVLEGIDLEVLTGEFVALLWFFNERKLFHVKGWVYDV